LTHTVDEILKVDFKSKVGCISAKSPQVVIVPSRRLQVALVSSGVRLADQSLPGLCRSIHIFDNSLAGFITLYDCKCKEKFDNNNK